LFWNSRRQKSILPGFLELGDFPDSKLRKPKIQLQVEAVSKDFPTQQFAKYLIFGESKIKEL